MSKSVSRSPAVSGLGAGSIILIILIILKLSGAVQLSWPLIVLCSLIPFGIAIGLAVLIMLIGMALFTVAFIADLFMHRGKK